MAMGIFHGRFQAPLLRYEPTNCPINLMYLTLPGGVPIKLGPLPEEAVNNAEIFFCCSACGKVFWEGKHHKRANAQFSYILESHQRLVCHSEILLHVLVHCLLIFVCCVVQCQVLQTEEIFFASLSCFYQRSKFTSVQYVLSGFFCNKSFYLFLFVSQALCVMQGHNTKGMKVISLSSLYCLQLLKL